MSTAPRRAKGTSKNGSKLTEEEMKHLLEGHLSFKIHDETLFITVTGCEEEECPVPENVSFFYCQRPPCPI